MNKYKKGDGVKVRITAIEKYGAFAMIDEEYSGLIHISEITKKYVRDITDFIDVGDVIDVKIIDDFIQSNQLKLSVKEVNGNLQNKKSRKIKETIFGFYLLKSALPSWINEKIKEINKNL